MIQINARTNNSTNNDVKNCDYYDNATNSPQLPDIFSIFRYNGYFKKLWIKFHFHK